MLIIQQTSEQLKSEPSMAYWQEPNPLWKLVMSKVGASLWKFMKSSVDLGWVTNRPYMGHLIKQSRGNFLQWCLYWVFTITKSGTELKDVSLIKEKREGKIEESLPSFIWITSMGEGSGAFLNSL